MPFEEKPLKIGYFDKDLQKHCITFTEYGKFYDFYDPRELISKFLMAFEQNFVPRQNLEKVRFKCSFTIIKRQPPPAVGFIELNGARVWVTNFYEGVYSNDFIKTEITNDIKKRIIFNERFDCLCISKSAISIKYLKIFYSI